MEALFNPTYPYRMPRHATYARKGMVATSQALAAQAGLEILKKGGNAVDAAIATAACLTVVEPTSNGIGGDAFAIIWFNEQMYGLNASGKSPASISIEAVKERGYESMPAHGFLPVTVPGAPGAWATLIDHFGNLTLEEVLAPAIRYAEEGFPVSPTVAKLWREQYAEYKEALNDEVFSEWFRVFAPKGRAPRAGEVWRSPDHAKTLREIAQTQAQSFYKGEIAEKISNFFADNGGFLSFSDLAAYEPKWVNPVRLRYRDYDIWEIPPNGLGIVALMTLNILKGYTFSAKDHVDTYHKQIEALKLSFTDGLEHITDPRYMRYTTEALLSETYAEERRKLIGDEALLPRPGKPPASGTVYLATADEAGNMVSFIQSNYRGFGSGLVVPGTGIALHNRGYHFSLDPEHTNALAGGKQTYHTIIPGFVTKNNRAIGPFGVMGGYMQPQGHVQVLMNAIDFQMNPQAALDAPRWKWITEKKVEVESHFPRHIAHELALKGHEVTMQLDGNSFGHGQIIWRDEDTGIYVGGSESRIDGVVAAW